MPYNLTEKDCLLIAKTQYGLENILAQELREIGAKKICVENRAVTFFGNMYMMYKANMFLSTAISVLKPIKTFKIQDEEDLYLNVQKIDWSSFLSLHNTFSVHATIHSTYFKHSKYLSLKCKDAIVDQFRKKYQARPSIDTVSPSVKIHVRINHKDCTISLDSSGAPLYKRGYRPHTSHIAPLNEVLASGLISLSGWDKKSTFIDPMCGSGTLLIEAAMKAYNIAPCIFRKTYGFQTWKDYDHTLYRNIYKEACKKIKYNDTKIIGSDISRQAISDSRKNIMTAKLDAHIHLSVQNIKDRSKPLQKSGTLIINPPYGERIKEKDIYTLYKKIGDVLKHTYAGFNAWIISSNKKAYKHIELKPSKKISLYNGALPCTYLRYDIYEGSRRKKNQSHI